MAANDGEFEANAFGLLITKQNVIEEKPVEIELSDMNIALPYNDLQQRGLIPESKVA
jgi:hypothetical protein